LPTSRLASSPVRRYRRSRAYALETPLTYEPIGIALSGNDPLLLNWTQNWLPGAGNDGASRNDDDRCVKDTAWLRRLP